MSKKMKRILLVEAEPVLAEVTSFRLDLHGYAVETVASADDALRITAAEQFDIILMDLSLPGMGGHGLLEEFACKESTSNIPIMVLSTDADLDQVQKAVAKGAIDFLVVPFDPEALMDKVAKLADRADENEKARKKAAAKTRR